MQHGKRPLRWTFPSLTIVLCALALGLGVFGLTTEQWSMVDAGILIQTSEARQRTEGYAGCFEGTIGLWEACFQRRLFVNIAIWEEAECFPTKTSVVALGSGKLVRSVLVMAIIAVSSGVVLLALLLCVYWTRGTHELHLRWGILVALLVTTLAGLCAVTLWGLQHEIYSSRLDFVTSFYSPNEYSFYDYRAFYGTSFQLTFAALVLNVLTLVGLMGNLRSQKVHSRSKPAMLLLNTNTGPLIVTDSLLHAALLEEYLQSIGATDTTEPRFVFIQISVLRDTEPVLYA